MAVAEIAAPTGVDRVLDRALRKVNDAETFANSVASIALAEARKTARQQNGSNDGSLNVKIVTSLTVTAERGERRVEVALETPHGRVIYRI